MTNSTPLASVERTSAASACAQALRDAILSGAFAAGVRLPPERKLAGDFGVNRVTVRAALNTLAAEKLVTIRQGSGALVERFQETGGLDVLPAWIKLARSGAREQAVDAMADLLAVRRALASVLLPKLRGIDAAAIARIEAAVQAFAAVVNESTSTSGAMADSKRIADADLAVLRAVLAEANSPVLSMCMNPIASVLQGVPELRDAMFATPDANVLGWFALVEALRSRADVAGALADVLAQRDDATLHLLRNSKKKRRP